MNCRGRGRYLVAIRVFEFSFTFDLRVVLLTVIGGGAATLLFGLAAAWTALSIRTAEQLRNP